MVDMKELNDGHHPKYYLPQLLYCFLLSINKLAVVQIYIFVSFRLRFGVVYGTTERL